MDSILLSESCRVLDGLRSMMTEAIGENDYVQAYVEVPIALLIIEIAKRAEDDEGWFLRGKSATIQAIQARVNAALRGMFQRSKLLN